MGIITRLLGRLFPKPPLPPPLMDASRRAELDEAARDRLEKLDKFEQLKAEILSQEPRRRPRRQPR